MSSSNPTPEQLVAKIITALNDKKFLVADKLRDQLVNSHPEALTEILKISDIIERAKTSNLDEQHLAIWADLYKDLSEDETNNLFYSLKKVIVPPKKKILSHGTYNTKLFFIDKGTVTVFITKENKNKIITQLGPGDLLGEYTFTTISLCSASVVSTSTVQLRYVDIAIAEKWVDTTPALYDKVVAYCEQKGKIDDILRQKQLKRHNHPRFNVAGNAMATLLDSKGNKTTSYIKGVLSNVSESGCCFDIHCSKKALAKSLLAKVCHTKLTTGNKDDRIRISTIGKIVRVGCHLHNDYSIHMKFLKPVPKDVLRPLTHFKHSA